MSLLTTFGDTFGYSALESLANGTPVLATRQGALRNNRPWQNGILLDLPVTPDGEWVHLGTHDRAAPSFIRMWNDEVHRLAEQALEALVEVSAIPAACRQCDRPRAALPNDFRRNMQRDGGTIL